MILAPSDGEKAMQFVDVGALAGAEAKVMQPDAVLLECGARIFRRWRADRDRGAAADAVIDLIGIDHRLHARETAAACDRIRGSARSSRR